jgi:hypothetical protein
MDTREVLELAMIVRFGMTSDEVKMIDVQGGLFFAVIKPLRNNLAMILGCSVGILKV